jgi:F-type H+-transporting ATPase subunit epsilon
MASFQLDLVTPDRLIFSEQVQAARAPGVEGSFGVMAGHAPMLTELQIGLIKLTMPDHSEAFIATAGGFMEVTRQRVIILADSAELSDEIDVERARRAADRARRHLEVPGGDVHADDARRALERARNRIRVAELALNHHS